MPASQRAECWVSHRRTHWLLYCAWLGLSLAGNTRPLIAETIYCISFSAAFNQAGIPAWKSRSPNPLAENMVSHASLIHRGCFPWEVPRARSCHHKLLSKANSPVFCLVIATLRICASLADSAFWEYKYATLFNPWVHLLWERMQNFKAKGRNLNDFTVGLLHTPPPNYDLIVICSLRFMKV